MSIPKQLDPDALPQDAATEAQQLKALAQQAQARGELLTAMLHASDALMLFPNEREYLEVVDEIVVSTNDPLSLVPISTGAIHVATAAARARILMMQRDLKSALELLCEVVAVVPHIGYFDWARRWLQPHVVQGLGYPMLLESVVKTSVRLAGSVGVPADPADPRLVNVRAAAECLAAIRAVFHGDAFVWVGEIMARRRLGDPNATLAVAGPASQRFPQDWRIVTCMMNALIDAKRPDEAQQYARHAIQLDPEDLSPLHDLAWGYADADRIPEAARLVEELMQRQPNYPGGAASLHYLRFKAQGTEADRQALVLLRERNPWDRHLVNLANELDPVEPYFSFLRTPGDASASAARSVTNHLGPVFACCGAGANIAFEVKSRYLESPSVNVAFDTAIRALGGASARLDIQVAEVQTPDPRAEKAQVHFRIWAYEGTVARKVYPQAPPQAQQAIAWIADQLFRREVWDPAARQVATHHGPDWLQPFLSVLTDPPPPPAHGDFDGFTWTYRCQVATALVLSHLGPWESGPGRAALYSLAYGPTDWTTDAALIAFAWRVRENPALRPEVEQLFGWLRTQIPQRGYTCWEVVLVQLWLALGEHPENAKTELEEWLSDYFESLPEKNSVQRPERRFGGLTLREYAEFSVERDRIMGNVSMRGIGAALVSYTVAPPQELVALCQRFGVPMRQDGGSVAPYITEWQEAINADEDLQQEYVELQRELALAKHGVSGEEKAALDQILDGNMDMHLRMAQAQQAQRAVAEGAAGDPDPVVFPGQRVAKLSDYVAIMKRMQGGDFMGALGAYGLDMMSYGSVAQAWGAKLAADPVLAEKFSKMMG